jgi:hypothetical protein
MTKKLAILVVGTVLLGVAAFVFSGQKNFSVISSAQNTSPEVPDNIVYQHLFRHVAAFKARADELERQGKDAGNFHRFFKRKADLSDEQTQMLEQIATQCVLEIKAIDERAKPIIEAYKAQYPNGQVPHGQLPAPPPAELREMTRERNELVLRKRDELRAAFGEERFKHFQQFVKNKIASNVNPVSAGQ